MAKQKITRDRTTTFLPWRTATNLVAAIMEDKQYNTALMVATGIYTGLRISDILSLLWKDLLSDQFTINEKKTNKRRTVTVHKELAELAEQVYNLSQKRNRPQPHDYVFVSQEPRGNKDEPISYQAAKKRFAKALRGHGVELENDGLHTLRKTFGRRVWENNGRTEQALIMLGKIFNHRDVQVTREYLGITQQEIGDIYLNL